MFKVNSHYLLLLTLVFSTAHAPSFMFWRNAGRAEAPTPGISEMSRASLTSSASLPREYAEEGDTKRFQLDELYLPNLDVTLPELFNWSDLDREYVADVGNQVDAIYFDPDRSRGASMHLASRGSMFAGLGSTGGSSSSSSNGGGSAGGDTTGTSQTGKGDSSAGPAEESMPGDESSTGPSDTDNTSRDPITDPTPTKPDLLEPVGPNPDDSVPVPAPGALGLLALGLAGLQLAGRKKKQKRLAAS